MDAVARSSRAADPRSVEQLLGIPSAATLAMSLIERSTLPRGRFEAHEFGRDQHSSASAGALLFGVAGIPFVPDSSISAIAADVESLVDEDGVLRGHDDGRHTGESSWPTAQVLLGLLTAGRRLGRPTRAAGVLARQLIALQDGQSGGWPYRAREEPRVIFSCYPILALCEVWRQGLLRTERVADALAAAARYLTDALEHMTGSPEERLLADMARRVLGSTLGVKLDDPALRDELRHGCWDPVNGMRLTDRPIMMTRQPTWYMVLWRPLLYLAVRRSAHPLTPLNALLGHELVSSYDKRVAGWRGPHAMTVAGSSWASALALRGTAALAADLSRAGIAVDEWLDRCRELRSEAFEFDVVVSFAGVDRTVASEISEVIRAAGYRVFYDHDYQHHLLGEDLTELLQDTYFRKSRFAVVVVSKAFIQSTWAGNWEWKAVLARMREQRESYVLPYMLDEIAVPGLNPTIGYVTRAQLSPREFGVLVTRKLRQRDRDS